MVFKESAKKRSIKQSFAPNVPAGNMNALHSPNHHTAPDKSVNLQTKKCCRALDSDTNGTVMPKSLSFQQLKVASVFERSDWVGRVSVFGV